MHVPYVCVNAAQVRTQLEHLVLWGLIDGPRKPKNLQTYMQPLVNELLELWQDGVRVFNAATDTVSRVRVMAVLMMHDNRALRDVSGLHDAGAHVVHAMPHVQCSDCAVPYQLMACVALQSTAVLSCCILTEAGTLSGCSKCDIEGLHIGGRYTYADNRRLLPADHPLRSDIRFGQPCNKAQYLDKTESGVRAHAVQNEAAYTENPSIRGTSADPARLNGVDFLSVFAALPYWDLIKSQLLGPMHMAAGQGKLAQPTFHVLHMHTIRTHLYHH